MILWELALQAMASPRAPQNSRRPGAPQANPGPRDEIARRPKTSSTGATPDRSLWGAGCAGRKIEASSIGGWTRPRQGATRAKKKLKTGNWKLKTGCIRAQAPSSRWNHRRRLTEGLLEAVCRRRVARPGRAESAVSRTRERRDETREAVIALQEYRRCPAPRVDGTFLHFLTGGPVHHRYARTLR